ncbi:hypothetical protein BH11MYX1_BH11MYX1_53390 [soil metagenome]
MLGLGVVWLVKGGDGSFALETTSNAYRSPRASLLAHARHHASRSLVSRPTARRGAIAVAEGYLTQDPESPDLGAVQSPVWFASCGSFFSTQPRTRGADSTAMGVKSDDRQPLRTQHESIAKKPKRKPHPKHALPSNKPRARAPDERPQTKTPAPQRTTAPTLVDVKERRHESEEAEEGAENPVGIGLEWWDNVSLAREANEARSVHGASYAEMAQHMAEESSEMWEEGATTTLAEGGATAASGLLSAVNVAGGLFEIYDGVKEYGHNKTDGAFGTAEGFATTTSGVAGIASLGGVASAGPVAPLAGSLSLGLKVGHHGDKQVKEMGWMHDSTGEAVTASDWAADKGQQAEDNVAQLTGSHTLALPSQKPVLQLRCCWSFSTKNDRQSPSVRIRVRSAHIRARS